jgi:biopolymer transport protein ExbB/TolQ
MNQLLKSLTSSKRVLHVVMLLVVVIIVHLVYITVVRPTAAEWMTTAEAKVKADPSFKPGRSIFVIIHEPEPEAAIIMAIWALLMCAQQWRYVQRCQDLLKRDLLHLGPGEVIVPKVAREYERGLDAVPADLAESVQVRALRAGLTRFRATQNVQDVSTTIHNVCDSEAVRLEAEISMIRFAAWCIPAIGFVGTVRGLGEALQRTGFALASNNPAAVTEGLGVSFNSTFVALTLSIFVMYAVYELQLAHDNITLDAEIYAENNLVSSLHADARDGETVS